MKKIEERYEHVRIRFVGAGNMAHSIMQGLRANGMPAERLRAADPAIEARDAAAALGIPTFSDNAEAAKDADVIVLAVKPQVAASVTDSVLDRPT